MKSGLIKFWSIVLVICALIAINVAVVSAQGPDTYERSETLYTSGTQWGPPSSWNPFNQGGYAMGTIGLCYETLFIFDPLTNEYKPWLAESGKWTSDTVTK
jgi:peptide/nickel transport system substrate-binding protein